MTVRIGRSPFFEHGDCLGHKKIGKGSAKAGAQKTPHARENSPPQEIVSLKSHFWRLFSFVARRESQLDESARISPSRSGWATSPPDSLDFL
jgi:hypothetical protein